METLFKNFDSFKKFCSFNDYEDNEENNNNKENINSQEKIIETTDENINKQIIKIFNLPISYCKNQKLNENIINDLELIKTHEKSNVSTYEIICSPSNCFGDVILKTLPKYYTTNKDFLRQTQKIIKNINVCKNKNDNLKCKKILNIYSEIKHDNGFLQKYLYVDYDFFKHLNNNELFLQILSMYNILSPIISFIMPIFLVILPFIVLKIQGITINFTTYKKIFCAIISEHSLGKIFTDFNKVDFDKKVYLVISAGLYIFSIYSNFMTCIRFYNNMKKIHEYTYELNDYIKNTIYSIQQFISITTNMHSYNTFNNVLNSKLSVLTELNEELDKISSPFNVSIKNFTQIGFVLKIFYKIHDNKQYNDAIIYSFGFNGYVDILTGISDKINSKHISYTSFLSKKNKHKGNFKNLFYPPLMNEKHTKNNYYFNKNIILTGVNASGKTSILKSVLINVILSQQFGIGCFQKAQIYPFHFIHCYLNILDTSDRLSLFQSECKKCHDIIKIIENNTKKTHLCVFDELFSGTNPEEAVNCGYGFLVFLNKFKNSKFLLTTHFLDLSKKFEQEIYTQNISNKKMESYYNINNSITHTYSIKNGINQIKGGFQVLKEMNYPKDILDLILKL